MKQDKKLAARVWSNYSKYRRLKESVDDYCRCVTCGVIKPWKEMQLGHYIHRGNQYYTNLDFDDQNIHPQCVSCNYYKSGKLDKYAKYLIKKFGNDILDILEYKKKLKAVLSDFTLKQLNKMYLEEIKRLT